MTEQYGRDGEVEREGGENTLAGSDIIPLYHIYALNKYAVKYRNKET